VSSQDTKSPQPSTTIHQQQGRCIGNFDGMPPSLKITNCTNQIIFDSSWTTGVDYDEEEFQEELNGSRRRK